MAETDNLDTMEAVAMAATPGEWSLGRVSMNGTAVTGAGSIGVGVAWCGANTAVGTHGGHSISPDEARANAEHLVLSQPRNVLAMISRLRTAEAVQDQFNGVVDDRNTEIAALRASLAEAEAEIERRDHRECTPLEERVVTAEENEDITASFLKESERQLGEVRAALAEAVEALGAVSWMAEEWYEHGGGDASMLSADYRSDLDRADAIIAKHKEPTDV